MVWPRLRFTAKDCLRNCRSWSSKIRSLDQIGQSIHAAPCPDSVKGICIFKTHGFQSGVLNRGFLKAKCMHFTLQRSHWLGCCLACTDCALCFSCQVSCSVGMQTCLRDGEGAGSTRTNNHPPAAVQHMKPTTATGNERKSLPGEAHNSKL